MSQIKKSIFSFLIFFLVTILSFPAISVSAKTSDAISFIVLTKYKTSVDIGNEFYICALTSTGALPSWKSSNSKVASVNTYGKVIAKKSGTASITAKIKNAEATCRITVNKTTVTINKSSDSIERGQTIKLTATASNNSKVTWKSSKTSIATIDGNGTVTGKKPGETTISAIADSTAVTCKITVKSPTIKLDKTKITLYRCHQAKVSASISSGISPVWKTNKTSVATVDQTGTITAIKHGTATITATVDGVSKSCEVVVEKPVITLSSTELNLKKGSKTKVTATVSSGILPIWASSKPEIAAVDKNGTITALSKGTAYIYAQEDGVKTRCIVKVSE